MRDVADLRPKPLGNTEWNRRYHDWYAETWRSDAGFRGVTGDSPGQADVIASVAPIGTEWAPPEDLAEVVERYVIPHLAGAARVLEVGPGGGRIARHVSGLVNCLVGADVSERMLAEATAITHARLRGIQIDGTSLPIRSDAIDFAYAFDVLVHADLHVMYRLFNELARVVRADGLIAIHTANLETAKGWDRFSGQDAYSPEGHFFVCPSTVKLLLRRAGFEVVVESEEEPANFYLARDYIVVARNPRTAR